MQAKTATPFAISDESKEVSKHIRSTVICGGLITLFVIIFFGVWAGMAPIDSAAIATGSVTLHENRKTVQHLEGGIIADILVKEGDEVTTGQPLIMLNATSANAQQEILLGQLRTLKATESRLISERDDGPSIRFTHTLLRDQTNPRVIELARSQQKLFKTRRNSLKGQIDMLQERIMQFNEQIRGLRAQGNEVKKQQQLLNDEVEIVESLFYKGMESKPKLLALQRRQSELTSELASYYSEVATIKGSITESQLQIINVQNEYLKEVMTELKDVQAEISDLQEKLHASGDVLDRTVIIAPQSGKVNALQFHTVGGVIGPGAPIMDIVPQNDKLIVEAQVQPQDIDIVYEGLSAKVMLSAYRSRFVPRLDGIVTYVSADKFTNEQTGLSHYLVRIEIEEEEIANLTEKVALYPGMPAEVFITTGETTMINYLASPIIDSFRRSFKEQ